MTKIRQRWLVVAAVCLLLCPAAAGARESAWEKFTAAGMEALNEDRLSKAEKKFLAALKEAEGFGTQDSRLAASLNNLAKLYYTQGKYDQVEQLLKRALAIEEKALGPEHPHVATSLGNLAELYREQGKYDQVEPLLKRALAIFEKALGPEHPDVALTLENYAGLLRKMERDAEAGKMEARAKEIRTKRVQDPP